MNTEALFVSFNEIDDELLERSEKTEHKKSVIKIKWLLSAACFGILALAVILINGLNLPDKLSSIFPTEEYTDYTNPFNDNPAFGDEPNVVTSVDKNLSVTKDTQLNLPVFVNPYPMGHGGAEYVVDDNIESLVRNNLNSFLNILGGEVSENTVTFNDKTALLKGMLKNGEEIVVNTTYLSVMTNKNSPFNVNMTDDELIAAIKENIYLTAMCKYLEITSPVISVERTQDFDNKTTVEIKIYQNDEDISQRIINSHFYCIKWDFSEETTFEGYTCRFRDTSKNIRGQMLSFAEAAEKNSIDLEKNFVDCTVEYSESVVSGYYVPCYVFTSKDTSASDKNENVYNQTVVPMYDVAEIESNSAVE